MLYLDLPGTYALVSKISGTPHGALGSWPQMMRSWYLILIPLKTYLTSGTCEQLNKFDDDSITIIIRDLSTVLPIFGVAAIDSFQYSSINKTSAKATKPERGAETQLNSAGGQGKMHQDSAVIDWAGQTPAIDSSAGTLSSLRTGDLAIQSGYGYEWRYGGCRRGKLVQIKGLYLLYCIGPAKREQDLTCFILRISLHHIRSWISIAL